MHVNPIFANNVNYNRPVANNNFSHKVNRPNQNPNFKGAYLDVYRDIMSSNLNYVSDLKRAFYKMVDALRKENLVNNHADFCFGCMEKNPKLLTIVNYFAGMKGVGKTTTPVTYAEKNGKIYWELIDDTLIFHNPADKESMILLEVRDHDELCCTKHFGPSYSEILTYYNSRNHDAHLKKHKKISGLHIGQSSETIHYNPDGTEQSFFDRLFKF